MDGRRAARKHRSQDPAYRSARPPPQGDVLTLLESVGVGDLVSVLPASGVGPGVSVEPGDVVSVLVGVGRDIVGAGVVAGLVAGLLWDGAGECVGGRDGAVVGCVCWLPVFSLGVTVGAGRTHRYSTNTPANSTSMIHVERRIRFSSDRSGPHISWTPSPVPSRRSSSR